MFRNHLLLLARNSNTFNYIPRLSYKHIGTASIAKSHSANMSIDKILDTTNTDKYYIQYCGFLSNHVAQVTVALHRLGATEEWIQKYVDWYVNRLEAPHPDKEPDSDFESLKGKHHSYYTILHHFLELMANKNNTIDEIIASEFPQYTLGLGSSALHGTIHTGYGYSAGNSRRVCEGLAYLHYSYSPLVHEKPLTSAKEIGKGTKTPLELLQILHDDRMLYNKMINDIKKEPWVLIAGSFNVRMAYLIRAHGDHFVSLLSDMKLDIAHTEEGDVDVNDIGKKVVDIALSTYVMADKVNDFFLLHGVTSAWSVLQLLPALRTDHALEVLEVYIIVLMATYVIQDCPKLSGALKPPSRVDSKQWYEIIQGTLSNTRRDEHTYKLVQVANDMWKLNPKMGHLYIQAAEIALSNSLSF